MIVSNHLRKRHIFIDHSRALGCFHQKNYQKTAHPGILGRGFAITRTCEHSRYPSADQPLSWGWTTK